MLKNLKFDAVMQLTETENLVVALFIRVVGGPATVSSGGGGSTPSSGWGRDKDEDEREWARRCAQMAMEMGRPQRRGWRR